MTIKIKEPNVFDNILKLFGKKRAVYLPSIANHYGYYCANRENFLRALFRPSSKSLPVDWVYPNELIESINHYEISKTSTVQTSDSVKR